jgi:hypothetical protein
MKEMIKITHHPLKNEYNIYNGKPNMEEKSARR